MLDRGHVENFLRLNGVDTGAPDEVIRSALVAANWHDTDVDVALMVLRENTHDHTQKVTALHQVFQTENKLSPDAISALLGIDIKVHRSKLEATRPRPLDTFTERNANLIAAVAVILFATIVIMSLLYLFKVGPFYHPV